MTQSALLAIETSTTEGSVALWLDGAVVFDEGFVSDRGHNSLLFAPLGRALEVLDGRGLERVLVGTGPGSYGGTRVGIAAAQGLGLARNCVVTGVVSLLATAEARSGSAGLAAGDARRGAWWTAGIGTDARVDGPVLCDAAELVRLVGAAFGRGEWVTTFDPLERLPLGEERRESLVIGRPSASRLIEAWLVMAEEERASLAGIPAEPCYLRPPHVTKAKTGHPLLRRK